MFFYNMREVESYMIRKKTELGKRYRGDCTEIVVEIAGLLVKEGLDPYLLAILGKLTDPNTNKREPLIPVAYARNLRSVKFAGHCVCVARDDHAELAYDPIMSQPLQLDTYLDTAFTVKPASWMVIPIQLTELISAQP
jgi:hypothetical protein